MTDASHRFRALFDDNHDRLLGYARRRTDTLHDAEDIVAETFLVAWRRLEDVPADEHGRLWLYGTARRVLANHHRSRTRHGRLVDRLTVQPPTAAPGPDSHDSVERQRIATAFADLSDTDRELLLLAGWEGLGPSQIAHVLDCTASTARVRLHRARRRFATALKHTHPREFPDARRRHRSSVPSRPDTETTT